MVAADTEFADSRRWKKREEGEEGGKSRWAKSPFKLVSTGTNFSCVSSCSLGTSPVQVQSC